MEVHLAEPGANENPLVILLRARQKAELFKVPLLVDLIEEAYIEGKSIVVFVNFRETLDNLLEELKQYSVSVIRGGQKEEERYEAIKSFQQDQTRICVCMMQAGGVGVSLDDRQGIHPRISLITPSYSAVEMKQALGRIHRASSKSKSLQYILFAAGTVEEDACKAVRAKLNNISLLNDGDLTGGVL
jgi:SNF2 family DNA or RNA helicase